MAENATIPSRVWILSHALCALGVTYLAVSNWWQGADPLGPVLYWTGQILYTFTAIFNVCVALRMIVRRRHLMGGTEGDEIV